MFAQERAILLDRSRPASTRGASLQGGCISHRMVRLPAQPHEHPHSRCGASAFAFEVWSKSGAGGLSDAVARAACEHESSRVLATLALADRCHRSHGACKTTSRSPSTARTICRQQKPKASSDQSSPKGVAKGAVFTPRLTDKLAKKTPCSSHP